MLCSWYFKQVILRFLPVSFLSEAKTSLKKITNKPTFININYSYNFHADLKIMVLETKNTYFSNT